MTAVERVTPFMTQERNQSPITEGHVAKKSTAKNSKYWSDLNSLSQTSSSQNSGPLFPEDDSLETDELNDSNDMVVNGNGRMSDDEIEEGELLSDEGDGKEDLRTKIVCANADEQNGSDELKTNETIPKMDDNASHEDSPLSSLEETPEENPHSGKGVLSQDADSPTEDTQPQCDNDTLNDNSDKVKSRIMNDNGVNSEKSSMVCEDSDSNSNGVSSKISKLLISSSDSDKKKVLVSETLKGNLKDAVRRVSVQSESDKDSGCSSPKSVGKGNLFENILQREDLFKDSEEDRKPESANEETKPNGSMDKETDQETDNVEECDKKCGNKMSASKSDGYTKSDIDSSNLDEPDPDANKNRENSAETNSEEVNDLKENSEEEMNEASKDDGVKTDDVAIKHDIEMAEDTECDKDSKIVTKVEDTECDKDSKIVTKVEDTGCDKDSKIITKVENIETTSTNKESIKKEEVGKQVNGGAKRPLSPADAPSTAAKRSKLEEMIGRLSSSVGKKPEEVENMDVESDSTSDSESSSENDKQITLSVKELHSIIQKRIDVVLKNEKAKMQKKVEELQSNVEVWKTQAQELQNQLMELSTKSPRERRRQSSKVQAAQYQQGLNSDGKSSPRTPTTPTGTAPSRPLLNNSTGQNAITVKNAQMRPIAPHPGKETVRSLLDQRGASTTTGSASRNVRPSPNAKTSASGKQPAFPSGCIDLTDDDDKGSSNKQATNMRTVVQTSQILTPVVPANALRSGILLPGSPVVLQPVTQGVRLGQGNVVYASGTSIVRPGVTVSGQVPQLRPGQILLQQQRSASNTVTVNRPPPPLKSAPGVQKHPAPLPPTPASAGTYPKQPPPKPSLKISRVQQGIVLSWNMTLAKSHSEITNYQLFAYQETSAAPSTNLWRKVGDVKALPLPMACTLTQFQEGNKYHFAVRAIDTHNRIGPFSDACSIHLAPSS